MSPDGLATAWRAPARYRQNQQSFYRYADNKRRTIITEIKDGWFDYSTHFPESARATIFAGHGGPSTKRTVEEGIEGWMEVQRAKKASSTLIHYISKAKPFGKKFGGAKIVDVSKSDLELCQAQLLKKRARAEDRERRVTVVRGVWADAFGDYILKFNPLERISNIESDHDNEYADPFNPEEIELIGNADTQRVGAARMVIFNC